MYVLCIFIYLYTNHYILHTDTSNVKITQNKKKQYLYLKTHSLTKCECYLGVFYTKKKEKMPTMKYARTNK